MTDITITQTLDVWDELTSAYYGENHYGGDVAEIYAFRLIPHTPTWHHDSKLGQEETERMGLIASKNLSTLIGLFCEKHPAKVTVNGQPYKKVLKEPICHRIHLTVKKK